MALDFVGNDIIHKINVKFMHAFLPDEIIMLNNTHQL